MPHRKNARPCRTRRWVVLISSLALLGAGLTACRGQSPAPATVGTDMPAPTGTDLAAPNGPLDATTIVAPTATVSESAARATERIAAVQPVFQRTIGFPGTAPGQIRLPFDVAVAPDGIIYVSDSKGVQKFAADGQFLARIGGDELKIAQGLAVGPDGTLYVSGAGPQVLVFDAQGVAKGTIGVSGSAPGQLAKPVDVAVDSQGNLYVADDGNGRVEKFAPAGRHLLTIGAPGEGREQLSRPHAVAVDDDGTVYVGMGDDFLIKRFRPDGRYLDSFGRSHADENMWRIGGLALDSAHNVYFSQAVGHKIQSFGAGAKPVFRWEFGSLGFGPQQFNTPTGIAIVNDEIYVADQSNDRVQVYALR